MITLRQAVIVEGKYDKIKLSNFIDAMIIETEGFGIFKNKEKLEFIKMLAQRRGIILMTDSDSAGFIIRNYLSDAVKKGEVIQVYVPEVFGRERRKMHDSADGLLGVEGLDEKMICDALAAAGVTGGERPDRAQVTKLMMYEDGFYGRDGSKELREQLCRKLGVPTRISANALPSVISNLFGEKEYKKAVSSLFLDKKV